jgi:endogenous inhibitor of DNA gyrase (YacG/DUF329 family)
MMSKPAGGAPGKCSICGRPAEYDYRPFCSRRCADVDLSRWLRGVYAIPDRTESEDGGEPTGSSPPISKGPARER